MKKLIVIKNTPSKLPILGTVVYTFLMHYYNVSDLWWGIYITLMAILWILVIWIMCNQERIDLFSEGALDKVFEDKIKDTLNNISDPKKPKSKFQIRLEEMARERNLNITKNN